MIELLGPRPSGNSPEAKYAQAVYDMLKERLRFLDSPTVKFNKTTRGIYAESKPGKGGGAASPPVYL